MQGEENNELITLGVGLYVGYTSKCKAKVDRRRMSSCEKGRTGVVGQSKTPVESKQEGRRAGEGENMKDLPSELVCMSAERTNVKQRSTTEQKVIM